MRAPRSLIPKPKMLRGPWKSSACPNLLRVSSCFSSLTWVLNMMSTYYSCPGPGDWGQVLEWWHKERSSTLTFGECTAGHCSSCKMSFVPRHSSVSHMEMLRPQEENWAQHMLVRLGHWGSSLCPCGPRTPWSLTWVLVKVEVLGPAFVMACASASSVSGNWWTGSQ